MIFKLLPILDKMEVFYQLPRTRERFNAYLLMLQGSQKKDMILPISGYNPMAKENVLLKLKELQQLNAEAITKAVLSDINSKISKKQPAEIEVVINLADDIGGAWSNIYTTDYTSKFEIAPLVKRNFCTPYFWVSEDFTETIIRQRTKEYVYRTIYFINKGIPTTLKNHVEQEVFVQKNITKEQQKPEYSNFDSLKKFYLEHLESENASLIFNFFYGDEASKSLTYATYGIKKQEGFEWIKYIANQQKKRS